MQDRVILIVESEVSIWPALQGALESEAAETVLIRDPYSTEEAANVTRYNIRAAAINSVHRSVAEALKVPVLVYGEQTAVPARVDASARCIRQKGSGSIAACPEHGDCACHGVPPRCVPDARGGV
jgi:hypothetical protein